MALNHASANVIARATMALDKEAWDRIAYFAFQPELHYDALAQVKSTTQTQPGSTVTFTKFGDLTVDVTPLNETQDVEAENFSDEKVSVTLNEYGKVVEKTRFQQATSYIPLNPVVARNLGFNAGITMDTLVRNVIQAGTNVAYSGDATARNTIDAADKLSANDIRRAVVELEDRNVPTFGGYYAGIAHPRPILDLREETGAAAWREVANAQAAEKIWNGDIGAFEKVRFMSTNRAPIFLAAGADPDTTGPLGPATVYGTLVVGQQALAKAVPIVPGFGDQPRVVDSPQIDKLRRFVAMGWYHVVGYGIFRQESLQRIESGASTDPALEA